MQNGLFSTVILGMTSLADELVILRADDVNMWSVVVQKMEAGDSLEGDVLMSGGSGVVWLELLAMFPRLKQWSKTLLAVVSIKWTSE